MPAYDLHSHTHYSDGRFSARELLEAAAAKGLRGLAITDHDNTRGLREALPIAKEAGIEIIPGIEITTRWPGAELPPGDANVDVLGYFIDLDNQEFQAFEAALLRDIHERIAECCRRLTANGHPIRMEDVLERNPRYGGALHLAQALIARKVARDWKEAVQIMDLVWLSGRDTPFTIRSVIEQIHLAGGVAVLAHPSIVRPQGKVMTREWLAKLVEMGLDGIEIYHHRLDNEARAHFLQLAQTFGLLISGGSDLHGWKNGLDDLGTQPVTEEIVDRLREAAKKYAAK